MRFRYSRFRYVKLTKKAWILIICGSILLSVVLLGLLFIGMEHIADTNGPDDYSLCQLTMDDILADRHSAYGSAAWYKKIGRATDVSGKLQDYDYTKCTYRAKKFSGVMAVHATKTNADTLTLQIQTKVTSGNLEVVILVDGQYYAKVPINSNQTIILENISGKLVVVKMAGESAALDITVERKGGL